MKSVRGFGGFRRRRIRGFPERPNARTIEHPNALSWLRGFMAPDYTTNEGSSQMLLGAPLAWNSVARKRNVKYGLNGVTPAQTECSRIPPLIAVMRRGRQLLIIAALIGCLGWSLLFDLASAASTTESPSGVSASGLAVGGFDRETLQKELAQPLEDLTGQPTEALRAHVQRLGDLHFALELAVDVSPVERRVLSEQILTRVGQVGLMIRQRTSEPQGPGKGRRTAATDAGPPPSGDLAGTLQENSGLLVRLLGGLLIAFALGYFMRERRAIKAASSAGDSDQRTDIQPRTPVGVGAPGEGRSMTLPEIRHALTSGRTVLLQMGYEIAPSRRRRFLRLARDAQGILRDLEGQTYTIWEDPSHPNRFYELLVCRRTEVLERLADAASPLSRLAEEIETCREHSGFRLHHAWLGALSDEPGATWIMPVGDGSPARRRVN